MGSTLIVLTAILIGRSSASGSVNITNFRFDYPKSNDDCRSAIVYFKTTEWTNSTLFKLHYYQPPDEWGFFSKTKEFKNICFLDKTKDGSGYCFPPNEDFIQGSTVYLKLEQLFQNGRWKNSTDYPLTIDFVKQRTGNLLNFNATVSDLTVELSWFQQWPKQTNENECNLGSLLQLGLKYDIKECWLSSKKKKNCTTKCVMGTQCLEFEDHGHCISTKDKRWQKCLFKLKNLNAGTRYSFQMRYTLGGSQPPSAFTDAVEVATLPEVPTIAPEVNCSVLDDHPFFQWRTQKEDFLYGNTYTHYELEWQIGYIKTSKQIPFEYTYYQLKTVKLSDYHRPIEFYLNVCTDKGCSKQKTSCIVAKTSTIAKSKESIVSVKLMIWALVGVVSFIVMVAISTIVYRRRDRRRQRSEDWRFGPREQPHYEYPPSIHGENRFNQLISQNIDDNLINSTHIRYEPLDLSQSPKS